MKSAYLLSDPNGNVTNGMFHNGGTLTIKDSQIVSSGANPPHYIVTYSGGHTILENALIGRVSAGPAWGGNRAAEPVIILGSGKITSDAASHVLRGMSAGNNYGCWSHKTGAYTTEGSTKTYNNGFAFLWSWNQAGKTVGVRPDSDFGPPLTTANANWALASWAKDQASRARAREHNVGTGFTCVEDS